MKKTIILSVVIDLSLSLLMAAGLIPTVWWIVFVAVIIQLVIAMIVGMTSKRCAHIFDSKRAVDFNDDPPCLKCGMYWSLISRQEYVMMWPDINEPGWFERVVLRRKTFERLTWFDRVVLRRKPLPLLIHITVPRR